MLSRKHYKEVAEILRRQRPQHPNALEDAMIKGIAHDLADMFKRDNPRFDRQKFMDAVFPDDWAERQIS